MTITKRAIVIFVAVIAASQTICASATELGDANSDGVINVADIAVTASHIKGIKALDENGQSQADADENGKIDVADIALIASHIKGIKALTKEEPITEPYPAYVSWKDYDDWAFSVGYPNGLLEPQGDYGMNMDYLHTPASSKAYTSGKIVIGDSRCCQLGVYQQRADRSDHAVFAVWAGHYAGGTSYPILSESHKADVEACFHEQIRTKGECTVYFFATVNDYDFSYNYNSNYIAAAISAAEDIASMTFEYNGTTYKPTVKMIGIEGGRTDGPIYSTPQEVFNQYVSDYNDNLSQAVRSSDLLDSFTTVHEITGGANFIDDGLHYSDSTLKKLTEYIIYN